MSLLARWMGKHSFPQGIHVPEYKEATEDSKIRRLAFPPEMFVPLSQHTGAPAKPIVHEKQEVVRGEPIAEADGFMSVPMHAPATGVVEQIELARDARGLMSPAIYIRPYPSSSQEVLYGHDIDIDLLSREELIQAVQATGVVGLGGAAFPTHVKLSVPEGKNCDTVIANGCECEPYLTTDHRVMVEYPKAVFKGLEIVMKAMGAKEGIVGIEDNKPEAIKALEANVPEGKNIRVGVCETKYPQGAEKMLIKSLLDREVPSGGLPIDCGVGVFNVATLAQIGELLPRGQGLVERVITVTGPGVTKPGNYIAPLGTPLRYVLDFCGYRGDEVSQVILGGPMMGASASSLEMPIVKGITGILVLTKAGLPTINDDSALPCIKCGTCVHSCPMVLNPSQLGLLAQYTEYEAMAEQHNLMDCFECGCCTYVCPSGIPLVQYFRIAKSIVRQRKAEAKKQ